MPGLLPRQLLEVVVPLHGLNDSPKRWFLQTTSVLELLGWKLSALDECRSFFLRPWREPAGGRIVHACRRRSLGREWCSISRFGGCAEGKISGHNMEKKLMTILRQFDHARWQHQRDHSVTEFHMHWSDQTIWCESEQNRRLKSSLFVNAREQYNG